MVRYSRDRRRDGIGVENGLGDLARAKALHDDQPDRPYGPSPPAVAPGCQPGYVACDPRFFFPKSVPRWLPRTGLVLIDWLSMMAALGSGSRPIWVRTSRRKLLIAFSQVPSSFQRRKEWYTVFPLGKSWGICLHEQPVRRRYKIAFTISRREMVSRVASGDGSGMNGARRSHWASVRSDG